MIAYPPAPANRDYERAVHAEHLRLGFRSGNCRPCAIARQAERERACGHTAITVDVVRDAIAKCFRYWDSSFSYITCPSCGWAGYPEVEDNPEADGPDEIVVFYDEPKGAGA